MQLVVRYTRDYLVHAYFPKGYNRVLGLTITTLNVIGRSIEDAIGANIVVTSGIKLEIDKAGMANGLDEVLLKRPKHLLQVIEARIALLACLLVGALGLLHVDPLLFGVIGLAFAARGRLDRGLAREGTCLLVLHLEGVDMEACRFGLFGHHHLGAKVALRLGAVLEEQCAGGTVGAGALAALVVAAHAHGGRVLGAARTDHVLALGASWGDEVEDVTFGKRLSAACIAKLELVDLAHGGNHLRRHPRVGFDGVEDGNNSACVARHGVVALALLSVPAQEGLWSAVGGKGRTARQPDGPPDPSGTLQSDLHE